MYHLTISLNLLVEGDDKIKSINLSGICALLTMSQHRSIEGLFRKLSEAILKIAEEEQDQSNID